MDCREARKLLDGWIDGEEAEPAHLAFCPECRREGAARRELRDRLRGIRLPSPPGLESGIRQALAPHRRNLLPATAAAGLLVGLLFLFQPAPGETLPELVVRAADFHDLVVRGQVRTEKGNRPETLAKYFRDRLNLEVAVPPPGKDTSLAGGCCCRMPGMELATPYILYRMRDIPVSLLIFEDHHSPFPSSTRRLREGQEYFVFRCAQWTVLACCSGPVCHLWVAEMDEGSLVQAILATSVGREAFSGERLSLRGVT